MRGGKASSISAQRRRWPLFLSGLVVGAVGLGIGQRVLDSEDSVDAVEESVTLTTVEVTTADLLEEIEWAGTLDFTGRTSVSRSAGIVTGVVEAGMTIEQGDRLIEVDGDPVVLFIGATPFFRTLVEDTEGPDVFELESNLVALGYDPDNTVTVDETFTYNTGLMVQRWQEAIGVEVTGTVEADAGVVVASPMVLLSSPDVGDQANATPLELAPPSDMVVTVPVAVADADEWELGDRAVVLLADESSFDAVVTVIGTEITADDDGRTLDVTLEPVGDTPDLFDGAVTVTTIGEEVRDATVVPTRALVALAEGGFAVEVVDAAGVSTLVGIEIGAFDDGIVEVVAGALATGDTVVVPQ